VSESGDLLESRREFTPHRLTYIVLVFFSMFVFLGIFFFLSCGMNLIFRLSEWADAAVLDHIAMSGETFHAAVPGTREWSFARMASFMDLEGAWAVKSSQASIAHISQRPALRIVLHNAWLMMVGGIGAVWVVRRAHQLPIPHRMRERCRWRSMMSGKRAGRLATRSTVGAN